MIRPLQALKKHFSYDGFTLVELVVVVAIMAIVATLTVTIWRNALIDRAPRQAAAEIAEALNQAQRYARSHSVRTRVVIATPAFAASMPQALPQAGGFCYAIYVFHLPTPPNLPSEWNKQAAGAELAPMVATSLPAGFVGQWIPCPKAPQWRALPQGVAIDSPLFTQPVDSIFPQPAQTWAPYPQGSNPFSTQTMHAIFPQNYRQTPVPAAYDLTQTNLPPEEPSSLLLDGEPLKYYDSATPLKSLWPLNTPYTYFAGASPLTLGQVEDASMGASRRFFDLHGVEFDAQGRVYLPWTDELQLNVYAASQPKNAVHVVLSRATHRARVAD